MKNVILTIAAVFTFANANAETLSSQQSPEQVGMVVVTQDGQEFDINTLTFKPSYTKCKRGACKVVSGVYYWCPTGTSWINLGTEGCPL